MEESRCTYSDYHSGYLAEFDESEGGGDIPGLHSDAVTIGKLFAELRSRTKIGRDDFHGLKALEVYVGEWKMRHEVELLGGGGWLGLGPWECGVDGHGRQRRIGGQTTEEV
jgi:hypothetical protein